MSLPSGSRNDRWFVIAATAAFVTLLVLGSATTFRVDDWDLVANRSLGDVGSLLTPFNQQFIAVPAGIFRLIFAVVGLHSYLPYLAVLLAIHVVTAVVVRRLVAELAGPSLGQAAGIVVLFLGVGYENLNAAFQIGQVTATVTGLLAIEAVGLRRRPRLAAGLLVVSLASHAVGAAYLVGAVVAALAVDRRSLRWMALPVFVIGAWALAFDLRQLASRDEPLAAALAAVPAFMVVGPLAATGAVFGLGSAGGALLVALAAIAATVSRSRPASAPLVAATGAAILTEFALIAVSRSSYGIGATGWSRYLYSAVPLVLVFAAAWVGSATRIHDEPHRRRAGLVLGALTMVAVSGNMRVYLSSRDLTDEYVQRVRAAAAIASWSPLAGPLTSDPLLPAPDRLRTLFTAHGSPARDDLIAQVVTAVPTGLARQACVEMLPWMTNVDPCLVAVQEAVGRP